MSITKLAEKYIREHPSVKDCLKNDIVNFSSLSRKIAIELGLNVRKDFDAILIACRRFQGKLKREEELEKKIIVILKRSKIEIKNKMISVVLEKNIFLEHLLDIEGKVKKRNEIFRIIEGVSAITIITSEDFLALINRYFKNKTIIQNKDLAEITIKSPKEIHVTPGVYAYLCSLFGENNINIVGTLSCWTDTIFLINDSDAGKVINLMKF